MFRYLAFSWVALDPSQADLAHRVDQTLCRSGWVPALKLSGHRVYTTGNKAGVNDIYPLPSNQGVILGRLFRRSSATTTCADDVDLTETEAERIVHTAGRVLVEQFWGRYVAFLPSWTGEARVLRDPTGTLPCYRVEVQGVAIVLSWLEDLYAVLEIPPTPLSWDAVAAHMFFGQLGGRETALAGVTQVLAGELTPMTSHSSEPLRLWSAVEIASQAWTADPAEAAGLLRSTVLKCVQSWASCYESIVLRLSGGLDSSILLGSLSAGARQSILACLNYHSPDSDSDERHFARLAAQRAGATLVERPLDDDFCLDDILAVARTPVPANYIGRMGTDKSDAEVAASREAGAIFTGAAGDQLFFEYRCTWPAADYLKLRGLNPGLLGAALDSAHLGRVSFWSALQKAFLDRSFRGNPAVGAGRFLTLMQRDAMDAAAQTADRFLHPESFKAADLPVGKFHQLDGLICPVEYYNPYLREAAPELVHPLLSQPLLELALAIPTYILTFGGRSRGLARSAFANDIPPEIASRRSKGGMNEYVAKVLKRNLPFAREMLLDGLLARRGLLDLQRVEVALSGRPSSNASYVSEIHACIATEAWLRRAASHRTN